MNIRPHIGISLLISLALAVPLLAVAIHGAHWRTLQMTARRGDPALLVLASLVLTASFLLRAARWCILLRTKTTITLATSFWGTAIGYLGNGVLPGRAGEVVRSVLVARCAATPVGYVFATALVERITDACSLAILGLTIPLTLAGTPAWTPTAAKTVLLLSAGCLAVFWSLDWLRRQVAVLFSPLRRLPPRLQAIGMDFVQGMLALKRSRRITFFIFLTAAIWLNDGIFAVVVAHTLHLALAMPQALLLLVALGLGSAAPSTPGYIGIYQFVAVEVLTPFSFSRDQALAYILVFQGVTYAVVIVWGLIGLWQLRRAWRLPEPREARGSSRTQPLCQ